MPDRDVPGIRAIACQRPMIPASFSDQRVSSLVAGAGLVGPVQTRPKISIVQPISAIDRIASSRPVSFRITPDDHHGYRRDHKAERQQCALGVDLPAQQAGDAGHGDSHIGPEIQDDREQRADMHRDVDHLPLILQPGQVGQQDQMARGRDRQEFGQALNDAQPEGDGGGACCDPADSVR